MIGVIQFRPVAFPRGGQPDPVFMNQDTPSTPSDESRPLISTGLLRKAAICIGVMGFLTLALSIGGRAIGERIVMSGHSIDTSPVAISLNGTTVVLPANAIRFENQRKGGIHKRIDAYFTWPELEGYTHESRRHFNDIENSNRLVFFVIVSTHHAHGHVGTPRTGLQPAHRRRNALKGKRLAGLCI